MKQTKLKLAASFSQRKGDSSNLSLSTYVSTDNILQNKAGITVASNLPPNGNSFCKYRKGDILVSNIRPYLKKIWYAKKEGLCSSDVLVFECHEGYDSKFVYYSLHEDTFFEHMMKGAKGTKMPRGDKNHILEFKILDTPLANQRKIASVLAALDDKIELNNRINAELEAMAKTIYDYWFVQFDFPNTNGKPYKSSGGKMAWNDVLKKEIPDGWGVEDLNNVTSHILDHRGKTPLKLGGDWVNKGQGVIALSAKHVKNGKLIKLEEANIVGFEMYDKWMPEKLKECDILMTSEAPLGEFYFILSDTNYCMSQRLFAIRALHSKVLPTYLYYELSKGNGYSQILGKQSGSTVFGIRQDELRTVIVLNPKLELQELFELKAKPMLSQIRNNEFQNQKLSELRDWLVPMLMNGQVTVGDICEQVEEALGMAAET